MLSLSHGRPIAKTPKPNVMVLYVVDTDDEPKMKINKKTKRKRKCCRNCDIDDCEDEPCCNNCRVYYESESESSEEDLSVIGTSFNSKGKKLIPLPDLLGRFIEYIAGPSGSGKSTIAGELAMQFKIIFPNKPIYIFSRTDAKKDPAFNKIKPIQIMVDESLIEDPIDVTEEVTEEGCLMIFDDCNTIHNDKVRKEIEKLMADAMEVGRKLNCNLIITSHLVIPNEKKLARTILNELNMLTVFPKSGSAQQIKYALKTYWGLTNKQMDTILAIKSRWIRISKNYPQYVLYEGGAFIL